MPRETRREDQKAADHAPTEPAFPMRPPAPAPRPGGALLQQLDPERAIRDTQIAALNKLARTGRIDWAEWSRRVKELREAPTAPHSAELDEARATAAEARVARERNDATRQRETTEERER